MGARKTNQALKDESVAQIKKAENRAATAPLPKGFSKKATDQSSANAMNDAVQKDVTAQEAADEKQADPLAGNDAPQDNPDVTTASPETEEVDQAAEDDLAREEEIERRAEERYQQKMAQTPPQVHAASPAEIEAQAHVRCCVKAAAAINGILLHRDMLPVNRDGLNKLFEMLEVVQKKVEARSKSAPDGKHFEVVRIGKLKIDFGSTDRVNQIYTDALMGHCQLLLDAAGDLEKKWRGLWVGGVKQLLKALG